jgi:RimJ/RimL family protein N-acetyltransferase
MLVGARVHLRAIEPADYPLLHRWLNAPDVMLYWGRPGNTQSLAEIAEDEDRQARRGNSRKYIIETTDGRPIGEIDYYDLDLIARSVWTSILIGEPEFWGGGYGTDAMRTLLLYLFRELGVHRVVLTTHETNTRARRSYEKNGFVLEGVLRDWSFFGGTYVNSVIMAVLDRDFEKLESNRS